MGNIKSQVIYVASYGIVSYLTSTEIQMLQAA